ncbi:hypothetical protein C8Q76DRAFT_856659 [Earliella scabrosa]|nr:hypothetical protein C8Q76DRAFT_856659 [Earliella scabrosa]
MATLPDAHMRQIRNIDYCSAKLEPLLPDRRLKLPGGTLKAFAAVLQGAADDDTRMRAPIDFQAVMNVLRISVSHCM